MTRLNKAIMEAGFGEQGADWQANDISWMSHYTLSPVHTHTECYNTVLHLFQGSTHYMLCVEGFLFLFLVCNYSDELAAQPQ